jgi:hypothetical protein
MQMPQELRHSFARSALLRDGLRREEGSFSLVSGDFRPRLQVVASLTGLGRISLDKSEQNAI